MPKRILVVSHDRPLRSTRVELLKKAGYTVESIASDDDAMALLEMERFDLILLGRRSLLPRTGLDQRWREKYPDLLTLKIVGDEPDASVYPSRMTDSEPGHVLAALREMVGNGLQLVPLDPGISAADVKHLLERASAPGEPRRDVRQEINRRSRDPGD